MADVKLNSLKFPNLPDRYILDADKVNYSDSETYVDGSVGKALQNKAEVDGSYDSMTVGNAEQLVSNVRVNDKTPYLFRTSGGSVDIGDREYVNGIVGGTVAWNQLTASDRVTQTISDIQYTNNGDGSFTVNGTATANAIFYTDANPDIPMIPNHIYFVGGCPIGGSASTYRLGLTQGGQSITSDYGNGKIAKAGNSDTNNISTVIFIYDGTTVNNLKFTPQAFDLTQMFGSTIADYIYSLETANAGAGVAWFKKLFNKPYYAYNAGELKSVSGLVSHDMTGFNAWDEEWESGAYDTTTGAKTSYSGRIRNKNLIPVLPSTTYYMKAPTDTAIYWKCYYDANGAFIRTIGSSSNSVFTTPQNAYYMSFYTESAYGSATYQNDICLNLSWDGSRDGEYEPYVKHSYPLDSDITLRGLFKLDANNSLYADGDIYPPSGEVARKYGVKDIPTNLTWSTSLNGAYVSLSTLGISPKQESGSIARTANCISNVLAQNIEGWDGIRNHTIPSFLITTDNYFVINIGTTSPSSSDINTWLTSHPMKLVYELATPTTETADPYQQTEIVSDFGTEEFVIDDDVFAIPVGTDTEYPIDLRAKLEMAPNSPSDGDGDYILRQTNGMNEYVPLVIEDALPQIPSATGSYVLTVTVADGVDPVLAWTQA